MYHIYPINQSIIYLEGIIRAGVGGCTSGWVVGAPGEDGGNLHSIVQSAEGQGTKALGILGMDSEKSEVTTRPGDQYGVV